jgi:hypothetical protein
VCAGSNPVGGAAFDQPKRRLTWKNQQRSIFALMLLCAVVSRRLSVIVPHTCRGLNEVPAGVPTERQVPIPGFVVVVRVVPRSADSPRLPCAATPSAGKREPGEEHAAAAVRIRKVFVEQLAPAVSGPGVDGGGAVAGSGDSNLRSRYPKYDDFLAVRDWLDHTGCSGTPIPSRCSAPDPGWQAIPWPHAYT